MSVPFNVSVGGEIFDFCLFMCCRNVHVVKEVSKDDVLFHLATNPVREGELPKDFILLVSKRVLLDNSKR